MRATRLILPAAALAAALLMLLTHPGIAPEVARAAGASAARGLRIAAVIMAWLSAAWLLSRLADLALARAAQRGRRALPRLASDLIRACIFGLAILGILTSVLGPSATGVLATSSVLIAVLGFALRNIIADVFSGIALGIEGPYHLGDWIEAAPGMSGKVVEINWRATTLATNDGRQLVVPNGLLAGERLVNHSRPDPWYRCAVRVSLDAAVPVARAKRLLLSGALLAPRILSHPRPDVLVEAVDERGICYLVRYWVPDHGGEIVCRDAVLASVLDRLARAGVEPAVPKRRLGRIGRRGNGDADIRPARRLLGEVEIFSAFEPPELDEIAASARERFVPEGQAVVRQGEDGSSLFVVAEGILDVRRVADGVSLVLDRMAQGDVFGEMSLLTGERRSATVEAATDAVVFEIDSRHLDPIMRGRPELAERLCELMARRQGLNRARASAEDGRRLEEPAASRQDFLSRLRAFFSLPA